MYFFAVSCKTTTRRFDGNTKGKHSTFSFCLYSKNVSPRPCNAKVIGDQIIPKYRHITWKTVANQENKFLKFQCHFSPFGHEDFFNFFHLFFFWNNKINKDKNKFTNCLQVFIFFDRQISLLSDSLYNHRSHQLGSWPGLKLTTK